MVPADFQALFPSIQVDQLDSQKDKYFILQSLLHTATGPAWDWMQKTYTKEDISEVILTSKSLAPRDVYYWANKFNLPLEQIKCLQKNSPEQSQVFWNK